MIKEDLPVTSAAPFTREQLRLLKRFPEQLVILVSSFPVVMLKKNCKIIFKDFPNSAIFVKAKFTLHGDQNDQESNFIQLIKLRGTDDPNIMKHLGQNTDKYTCHQVQNEIIQIMALSVLRKISEDFHSSPDFSLMADEVTDASNREQVVICLLRLTFL